MKQWCDVQDQDGFWKIGYIVQRQQNDKDTILKVRLDGYHPGYDTFYCHHSKKMYPVRTYTMGLNSCPQGKMVLREPLKLDELKLNHNRLTLISRMQNLLQSTQENIKIFMRTQLLTLVDKTIRTPFPLINHIKTCDLWINKLFISIINFYLKLLDFSKKSLQLIESDNKMARQLLLAMYEFSVMAKLIIGSHKSSKDFFEDQTNLTIKTDGFVDCIVMADNGILPFRIFFKNLSSVKLDLIDSKLKDAAFEVLQFFLDLCDKSKGELFDSKFAPQTKLVVDQIINFLKTFAAFHDENMKYLKFKVQIINRLETLELKLKPKKTSLLRNQIFGQNKDDKSKLKQKQAQVEMAKQQNASSKQVSNLEARVKKLEELLGNFTNLSDNMPAQKPEIQLPKSVKNLGQQQFLASLNWALSCGDLQTCKKLVTWRQNLLRLGKIAGWEIALQVGMKTMKKAEITHQDIIAVNMQMINNAKEVQKSNLPKEKFLGPLGRISKKQQQNPVIRAQRQ